jgi:hypothetical protein
MPGIGARYGPPRCSLRDCSARPPAAPSRQAESQARSAWSCSQTHAYSLRPPCLLRKRVYEGGKVCGITIQLYTICMGTSTGTEARASP